MKSITEYSEDDLISLMAQLNEPKFRAKQLYEWLHKHNARSYEEMKNLPKALREKLAKSYPLSTLTLVLSKDAPDNTKRYLFKLEDGNLIETVAMLGKPDGDDEESGHLTVCVSTQVGCTMMCAFCATGQEGFTRNLTSDEIVEQVIFAGNDMGRRVSNVVVMGQGEPFNNYDSVLTAVRMMNKDGGLEIGARHITISTCGIIRGLEKFASEPEQFRLAVSLHSAVQSTRNMLMPKLESQTLSQLKAALQNYQEMRGRRITLEYLLLEDVNDSDRDLNALIDFCDGLNAHVNLLHFNPGEDALFTSSPESVYKKWCTNLIGNGINATLRKSRGAEASAACGQLKNRH